MPDPNPIKVDLRIDLTPFVRFMQRAAAAIERLGRRLDQAPHHRRETPARSAMHAAYDRRRRARRRRRR